MNLLLQWRDHSTADARRGAALSGDINADGRLDAGDVAPLGTAPSSPSKIDAADLLLVERALRGEDVDGDTVSTASEISNGTSPFRADTDGDLLTDGLELTLGTDPARSDADGDGLTDAAEIAAGSDPEDRDTDGDGYLDGADTDPRGGVVYRHGDHLGSTTLTTRSGGEVIARAVYRPFGGVVPATASGPTHAPGEFGFTGQRYEKASGIYDYGARFYDPALGRFLQPDTVVPGGGLDPQGLNRYAYVRNNPLSYVDPTGMFWQELWGGVTNFFSNSGFSANPLRWPGEMVGAFGGALQNHGSPIFGGFGQAFSTIGAVLGAPGSMLQDIGTFGLHALGLAQGTSTTGVFSATREMWNTDVSKAAQGLMGTAGGLLGGVAKLAIGIGQMATTGATGTLMEGPREIGMAASMPRAGCCTGLGWPGIYGDRAYPTDNTKDSLASEWHDGVKNLFRSAGAQFGWIDRAWNGPGAEPGPYGQAVRILGTVGFGAIGVAQWAVGLREEPNCGESSCR